jgi:cytochrome P450
MRNGLNFPFTVLNLSAIRLADQLIDAVQDTGRMNLVEDFAFPLPITAIAELLGMAVEDRDRFRFWSKAPPAGAPARDGARRAALAARAAVSKPRFPLGRLVGADGVRLAAPRLAG